MGGKPRRPIQMFLTILCWNAQEQEDDEYPGIARSLYFPSLHSSTPQNETGYPLYKFC